MSVLISIKDSIKPGMSPFSKRILCYIITNDRYFRLFGKKADVTTLSNPDEWTQINSTGIQPKQTKPIEPTGESTIEERDFDSTFDDSFILRTKPIEMTEESGIASAHTFSFGEKESESTADEKSTASGIMRIILMEKGIIGDRFKLKVLNKKVIIIKFTHQTLIMYLRTRNLWDLDSTDSNHVERYDFRRKP